MSGKAVAKGAVQRTPEPKKRQYFRDRVRAWYRDHGRDFPWRHTRDPYETLVAELLLQQTDAPKAAKVYEDLLASFPTPADLAKAKVRDVLTFIRRIGLEYRAKRLIAISRAIEKRFCGQVPSDRKDLLSLPGVGPYIANAVLAAAFGHRAAIVDTNVVRVVGRFFGVQSPLRRARTDPRLWEFSHVLLPRRPEEAREWNYALLDFAAILCRHTRACCVVCPCHRKCFAFGQFSLRLRSGQTPGG